MEYDGLFLSNGPGDPAMCDATVAHIKDALKGNKPIFGICLGNQLLARAAGFDTYKLGYGNRGQNQPVVDMLTQKAYITPQNHGFAVDHTNLPAGWRPYVVTHSFTPTLQHSNTQTTGTSSTRTTVRTRV